MKNTYVIYHKNCSDGFGAAYAAWKKFGDEATYIAASYGEGFPTIPKGSKVFICDFSYKRDILVNKSKDCDITVIDHHATAKSDLEGLDFAIFDMNKSGAILTWEYFHPDKEIPAMLLYVQDRDLWKFDLPDSKFVNFAIWSLGYDFDVWDEVALGGDSSIEKLASSGKAIQKYCDRLIENMSKNKHKINIGGYSVSAVNTSSLISEVCDYLLKEDQGLLFSAAYFRSSDKTWKFSLRSREFDVSKVAEKYGGGGHKKAAGFSVDSLEDL